jgi:hypothetical protein
VATHINSQKRILNVTDTDLHTERQENPYTMVPISHLDGETTDLHSLSRNMHLITGEIFVAYDRICRNVVELQSLPTCAQFMYAFFFHLSILFRIH